MQQFGEFLLRARLVRENAAPFHVRFVRRFLGRPASTEPLSDRVRSFCEDLERQGLQDWQVRQAEQALRIYFVNFLRRTDWHRRAETPTVDADCGVNVLEALSGLRERLRTRHYSLRTETSYVDWARRFLAYAAEREPTPRPRVDSSLVQDSSYSPGRGARRVGEFPEPGDVGPALPVPRRDRGRRRRARN